MAIGRGKIRWRIMTDPRNRRIRLQCYATTLLLALSCGAAAQTCFDSSDMDVPTRTALESSAKRFFDMAAHGDTAALKQNSIPSLASDFSAVEAAIKDNQSNFLGAQATSRPPFLLKVEGSAPLPRAEFLCGVFGRSGQTANSAEFVIPNLLPGNYGMVILDVPGTKGSYTVSFVLQQQAADWKVGGFYVKPSQIGGHDGKWFADRARAFQAKGQQRNAWLYYLEARELAVPVPFMSTQMSDKLYDESQGLQPADLPRDGTTIDLTAEGKIYKLTTIFPLAVGDDLDLVVKYQSADVSNTAKTFQENRVVIQALLARFPEFRDAFDGVVARAVEPSGHDYGSLLPMKEIK